MRIFSNLNGLNIFFLNVFAKYFLRSRDKKFHWSALNRNYYPQDLDFIGNIGKVWGRLGFDGELSVKYLALPPPCLGGPGKLS